MLKYFSLLFFLCSTSYAVVYGRNDIAPLQDPSEQEKLMAQSVAMMSNNQNLQEWQENQKAEKLQTSIWSIFGIPGGDAQGKRKICPEVNFLDEITMGSCTGVLIAPDKIATASHCLVGKDQTEYLKNNSWIFNYTDPSQIKKEDIYHPISVELQLTQHVRVYESEERKAVNRERVSMGLNPLGPDMMDFNPYLDVAVVRLDRPVQGIKPAQIDLTPQAPGTPLTMVGHPLGLPQKIIRSGKIIETIGANYTTTTLDTLKGNSGGPVFNAKTGALIGLIVNQGLQYAFTFDRQDRCYRLQSYSEEELDAKNLSGFMNISLIAPAL